MRKKGRGRLERNPKRRDPKRRPLPETLKERNIYKKEGGGEPYTSRRPPQSFFSPVSIDFASSSRTSRVSFLSSLLK